MPKGVHTALLEQCVKAIPQKELKHYMLIYYAEVCHCFYNMHGEMD